MRNLRSAACSAVAGALALTALSGAGAHAATASAPVPNVYSITNINSGKCLTIGGGNLAEGARVVQWDCLSVADQKWQIIPIGTRAMQLRNMRTGKCLTADPAAPQAAAFQVTCSADPRQAWLLVKTGTTVRLTQAANGRNLGVVDASRSIGAPAVLANPAALGQDWSLNA
jgi:hypothetical protein